jgi:hypothetical protein
LPPTNVPHPKKQFQTERIFEDMKSKILAVVMVLGLAFISAVAET